MLNNSLPHLDSYRSTTRLGKPAPFTNNHGTFSFPNAPRMRPDASALLSPSVRSPLVADCDPVRHRDIGTRFGERLRELRRTHCLTQIDMAEMLGIDRSYISEVERGKKGISLVTLEIIALGFRLHPSELLRDL